MIKFVEFAFSMILSNSSQLSYLTADWWDFFCDEGRCQIRLNAEPSKYLAKLVKSNIIETRVFYVHHHSVDVGHMIIFYNWSTVFTQEGEIISEIKYIVTVYMLSWKL